MSTTNQVRNELQRFTFVVELKKAQRFETITLVAFTMSEALNLYRQTQLAKQPSKIVRVMN